MLNDKLLEGGFFCWVKLEFGLVGEYLPVFYFDNNEKNIAKLTRNKGILEKMS